MTKFRVSGSSNLDTGNGGNGKRDAPMDLVMEIATAATSTALVTAGVSIFEPEQSNKHGKRRMRREALAALSNSGSRKERTIRQQAQELTQLHQTVGHHAILVKARTACEGVQRLAIMT
jgi:hypothetical protein